MIFRNAIATAVFYVFFVVFENHPCTAKITPPEIGIGGYTASIKGNYKINSTGWSVHIWEQVTERTSFKLSVQSFRHNTVLRQIDYPFDLKLYGATTNRFRSVEIIGMTNIFRLGRASLDLGAGPAVLAAKEVTRGVNGSMISDGGWGFTTGISANAILAIHDVGNLPIVLRMELGMKYLINPFLARRISYSPANGVSTGDGYYEFTSTDSHDSISLVHFGLSLGYDFGRRKDRIR